MGDAFVKLTLEDKAGIADKIAAHWTVVEELEAKKKADAKRTQGDIDAELEEIGRLCRVVQNDGETKDQLELFVSEDAARDGLAQVAAASCSPVDARECPVHGDCVCSPAPGKDGVAVYEISCPLHGVDSLHAKAAPLPEEQLPTEEQEIAALAEECLADWKARGIVPESVNHRNHLVGEFFAVKQVASRRRKRVREAINAALADRPLPPAGAGAEPSEEGAEASA